MKLRKISFGLLLAVFLTACGTSTGENASGSNTDNNAPEVNEESDESVVEEQDIAIEKETLTLEGTFVGQVDANSIEFKTAEDVYVIQTLETDINFDSISEGSSATAEFYENEAGQNILQSFKVKE
ncbi:hypothetical protein FZC84_13125 [Rossellomorea vietnamensis]|uniref:Uncharacterized protein n=1 Tax=Rossellomorea vietnamensis TaxID=218284 RepID=A0A5D4MDA4_9BACI|nr:hypothetical protein [Rossellomorea vietnamensis]TYR98960.1 hypothetical protein FZC84_13125 [Rossellomorea vietnamensis]